MGKKSEKEELQVLTKQDFKKYLYFLCESGVGKKRVCQKIEHFIDKHVKDINTASLKTYLQDLQDEDVGRNKIINKMRNYADKIYTK